MPDIGTEKVFLFPKIFSRDMLGVLWLSSRVQDRHRKRVNAKNHVSNFILEYDAHSCDNEVCALELQVGF